MVFNHLFMGGLILRVSILYLSLPDCLFFSIAAMCIFKLHLQRVVFDYTQEETMSLQLNKLIWANKNTNKVLSFIPNIIQYAYFTILLLRC